MAVEPIEMTLKTPASPDIAWATLTEPRRIAEWFTDATRLGPVGSRYRLDFGDGSIVAGRVTDLVPGRRFGYSWSWEELEEATTHVTWTVDPLTDGGSRITLRHAGWDEAGADRATRDDHAGYWEGYLADLADVLAQAGG